MHNWKLEYSRLRARSQILLLSALWIWIIGACATSPEPTAARTMTASPGMASSRSETPTRTSTPTSTPATTPMSTISPSPTPTPLGGGSGRLMFFRDYSLWSLDANDESVVVLSHQQLVEAMGLESAFGVDGYLSPDGTKLLISACGDERCTPLRMLVALATSDLSTIRVLEFENSLRKVEWSRDSEELLVQVLPGGAVTEGFHTYIIGTTNIGSATKTSLGMAFSAFLSPDGQQVYISTRDGYTGVGSDGLAKGALKCDACSRYISYWGAVAPNGLRLVVVSPTNVLNIEVPNPSGGTGIATVSVNDIVIADREFSNSQVLVSGIFGEPLMQWSPDSRRLLVVSSTRDPASGKEVEELKVVEIDSGKITNLVLPEGTLAAYPCNWSPDSRLATYVARLEVSGERHSLLFVQNVEEDRPVRLTAFETGFERCPIWLSSSGGS